jgi:hypothetical protein
MPRAPAPETVDLAEARRLLANLFEEGLYRGEARLRPQDDAFAHYFRFGATLKPNIVFDPLWYLERNPDAGGVNPLLHYALVGEPADRDPSALFDVGWYKKTYAAERPLAHYLAHRFGPVSPIPEFDAPYYLRTYPDVGAAGLDPFLHYLHFGYREYRKPNALFNPRLYANRHLANDRAANPIVHLRANGGLAELAAPRSGPYEAVRRFARRGARFEPPASAPPDAQRQALALAFHLPQFHRIPENDAWWGEGFTEWTQLARAQPRFEGHYQPRIPERLGFYDLSGPDALAAQAALAKAAGVHGFVFYAYDFDGRRLLEKPLELFLNRPDIDIGFCLMWANENWTRRWDGAEDEVLIAQSYGEAHEAQRCAEFARHFRDPRYVRLAGRPLLMVYRASLIPETAKAIARWRGLFAAEGEQPILVMAQTFDDLDPRPLGFDAAVEFPPHKLTKGLPQIFDALDIYDDAFEADVFAYDDVVAASLSEPEPDFPLIKTAVPSWDNDARRQGLGLTLVGSTPAKFERWLAELIARATPVFGARVVCVNAWNEWCEGAYLEPDVHYGAAYLNAAQRAIYGAPAPAQPEAAKVSVFVLHGGGPFPTLRLRSLFAQTHPIFELVVLDAGEDSLDPVNAEAEAADRDVTLGLGVVDGIGAAAAMAGGELVWIVDSQGWSDRTALAALARALAAEPGASFAFCDSHPADGSGRPVYTRPNPLAPRQRPVSYTDRALNGAELRNRLAAHSAPPMSAILWRSDALAAALATAEGEDAQSLLAAVCSTPDARAAHVAEGLDFTMR